MSAYGWVFSLRQAGRELGNALPMLNKRHLVENLSKFLRKFYSTTISDRSIHIEKVANTQSIAILLILISVHCKNNERLSFSNSFNFFSCRGWTAVNIHQRRFLQSSLHANSLIIILSFSHLPISICISIFVYATNFLFISLLSQCFSLCLYP